eukprot:9626963-Karenia_brevis.AAC.1
MDLDEPPRSNLQLPKIGKQGASASAAIVPKQKWAVFKQPPIAVLREQYQDAIAKAGELPAPEAR